MKFCPSCGAEPKGDECPKCEYSLGGDPLNTWPDAADLVAGKAPVGVWADVDFQVVANALRAALEEEP